MFITEAISDRHFEFQSLCKAHSVKYLYAFGSSVTMRFDMEKSDIDLLVDIDLPDPVERGETLLSLWDTFEMFFKRKVDLLTESSIHNPYLRRSIDSTKVLIYDGTRQEVLV
ncbi:MAG TPA: nucleotidyltransferase domain-containing protein [Bacteroidales bacterium]|nr:nucleotidyltransferase domain-containing protein [Bacteroidales bacterium]HSA43776.1 nucleotidyltransferase domain-containing protein [Bacteroidales bacterium]